MNLDLSEEQRLLAESLEKWSARAYPFEKRQRIVAEGGGFDRAVWSDMAELGLLGLPFAEADGGFSGGAVETMIVLEACGRAGVVEPYLTSIVLAGAILRHGASTEQRAALVPAIASGDTILAPAWAEPQSRWNPSDVTTTATPTPTGWRLDGVKTLVPHGEIADRFIVSARTSGEGRIPLGIGLFLVDRVADGVEITGHALHDGSRAADLRLSGVTVGSEAAIGDPSRGLAVLERALDEAVAAVCAEAVGAMDRALALTVDHLKTRVQFGQAIGSFQALQHRAADMFVALEQARSMALWATMSVEEEDVVTRRKAMAAAKVQIAKSARFVGQQAIQLHGGIGMTWEYEVGHLYKRLTLIEKQFGDLDHHLDWLAATDGLLASA